MLTSGPDSMEVSTKAPASSCVPYCCISAAYRPPLVMSIAVTRASTDRPVNSPVWMPPGGKKRVATMATTQATRIFVTTRVPDFFSTTPVALRLIVAPMQKNQTARMGTVPVISPFVNEPKYLPASGAKVCTQAPSSSGISMSPPGTRSMVFWISMSRSSHFGGEFVIACRGVVR